MSDQMPHDDELRGLYRRLPADEPRAEVDAAILAAARTRAARASRTTLLRRIRWAVPLAAAAGVVLTFALMRLAPERRIPALLDEARPEAMTDGDRPAEPPTSPRPQALAEPVEPREVLPHPPGAEPKREAAAGQSVTAAKEDAASREARDDAPAARAPAAGSPAPASPRAASPPAASPAAAPPAASPPARSSTAGQLAAKETDEARPAGEAATEASASSRRLASTAAAPADSHQAKRAGETPPDASAVAACEAEPVDPAVAEERARAEAASVAALAAATRHWPFGLEPWLDATEACRRVAATFSAPCEFRGDVAVVEQPDRPTAADAGLFRGSPVVRITLHRRDGRLARVDLEFADGRPKPASLIAPEPPP